MSDAHDDRRQAALDKYVARHLGIPATFLDGHPYGLDEVTLHDGGAIAWRVSWTGSPPPGVTAHGGPIEWWNDIPIGDVEKTTESATAVLSVIASAITPEMKAALVGSSQFDPVTRVDLLTVGHQASRFMHHVVNAVMVMEGHNLNSLSKLSQAATIIDDFSAAVLAASHWNLHPTMEEDGE